MYILFVLLKSLVSHSTWLSWASLVAQTVKHLPAVWEIRLRSLGWEDPLEKEMATHSSTLAWKIPGTEEPGRLQSVGLRRVRHGPKESDTTERLHFLFHFPNSWLSYSCWRDLLFFRLCWLPDWVILLLYFYSTTWMPLL